MNGTQLGRGECRQSRREAERTARRGVDDINGGAELVRDGFDGLQTGRLPDGRQGILDGVADIRAGTRAAVAGVRVLKCLLSCEDIEDIREGVAAITEGIQNICRGLEELCRCRREAGLRRIRRGVEDVEDGSRFISDGLAGIQ